MKRGKIIENITIERLGYGGVGIATLENGKKILIKGGLPGSVVDCKVVKKKRDYLECHITAVHSVPKELIDGEVRCPHYMYPYHETDKDTPIWKKGCGGCKRQAVSYEKQLLLKEKIVRDAFSNYPDVALDTIVPSPKQFGYRNKIEFSFGKYLSRYPKEEQEEKGQWSVEQHRNMGFHKQGEFSKVVDVDQCYLVSDEMHSIYEFFKQALVVSGLPVYDVKRHEGVLRHLVVREGTNTGQHMVILSIATDNLEKSTAMSKKWKALVSSWKSNEKITAMVTTLVLLSNNGLADTVHGPETTMETIWGEGQIFEGLTFEGVEDMLRFQVSPFSFFQTNTLGAQELFSHAAKKVGDISGNIIDLYCGSGTIGLIFSALGIGKKIHGIDIVPSAIQDAHKNAQINGMGEITTYYCGKAEKLVKEGVIDEHCFVGNDLIVIDPPRQGLHKDVTTFMKLLKEQFPSHTLLYISCNPITMARDITELCTGGYHLDSLQPVDMFPHTHHIELIGILK